MITHPFIYWSSHTCGSMHMHMDLCTNTVTTKTSVYEDLMYI